MLAILVTHPIQYHVPLWQMLANNSQLRFEVWYLSRHATIESRDREFGRHFAWDLNMLEGYPYRFLRTPRRATPNTLFRLRISESLVDLFRDSHTRVLWVLGWQVSAYWQAVWAAKDAGLQVWLRGESNSLAPEPGQPKRLIKRVLLGQLFKRVDEFLCIGTANRDLYQSYGIAESKLHIAPYAVDNDRFAVQAAAIRNSRFEIRDSWRIPRDAYCVLFCGKFIPKKRPMDLIKAAQLLISNNLVTDNRATHIHLLFVGSGELGGEMHAACNVVFDADGQTSDVRPQISGTRPNASFAGFLNQTEISKAYVAADVLVLPSDYEETWGLVVNEAMASGLRCVVSDQCGCAPDLGTVGSNAVFHCGDSEDLAKQLAFHLPGSSSQDPPSLQQTSRVVQYLYSTSDSR